MRGKCRWCGTNQHGVGSVTIIEAGVYLDDGGSPECPTAPERVCEHCCGVGEIDGDDQDAAAGDDMDDEAGGPAERQREKCPECAGLGFLPGLHWPWRWPEPVDDAPAGLFAREWA